MIGQWQVKMKTKGSPEKDFRELAWALHHKAAEHKPSLFEPQNWMGRMIDWSVKDESPRATKEPVTELSLTPLRIA